LIVYLDRVAPPQHPLGGEGNQHRRSQVHADNLKHAVQTNGNPSITLTAHIAPAVDNRPTMTMATYMEQSSEVAIGGDSLLHANKMSHGALGMLSMMDSSALNSMTTSECVKELKVMMHNLVGFKVLSESRAYKMIRLFVAQECDCMIWTTSIRTSVVRQEATRVNGEVRGEAETGETVTGYLSEEESDTSENESM
jgi:hypothetical protein